MIMRKLWRSTLMVTHISSGLVLLVITGAVWRPYTPVVRSTMRWWLGRVTRILNIEIQVNGEIPHENEGAVLLVSNHVSWVDIPLIGGVTPICFLSKAEVAKWPLIGTLASKVGTLFIQRGSGDADRVTHTMANALGNQRSVLFFPEGTTTDGSSVRRLHPRLFKVCHHLPVTVYPVVIRYWSDEDHNPLPFIDDDEFTQHLWRMMGHKKLYASLEVLPPIQLSKQHLRGQVRMIEARMRSVLEGNVNEFLELDDEILELDKFLELDKILELNSYEQKLKSA